MKLSLQYRYIVLFLICFCGQIIPQQEQKLQGQEMSLHEKIGPFLFHTNFPVNEISTEINSLLNSYNDIKQRLMLPDPYELTDIYVYEDQNVYEDFFRKNFPGERIHPSVFTKNYVVLKKDADRSHIYVYRSDKLGEDLRHEGIHAILHSTIKKKIPIWLDEGLAEYYEQDGEKVNLWLNKRWLKQSIVRIQNKKFQNLGKLEQIVLPSSFPTVCYSDSWAWICFMLNGPEKIRAILPNYIKEYQAGGLFLTPLSRRMNAAGGNINALLQFLTYLQQSDTATADY